MSIRRFVLTLPALVLVLLVLVGFFPGGAAFAAGGGDPLALRFVCDETVASVTVYDLAGLPLPVGADGIHHLTPGTYFYSATAEGYESTGLQAFTIPADAAGDQELRISLTPVPGSVPPDAAAPGKTPPDASVPGQTPVNVPDPNAPEENPEDDGKLRIRPVDGSLTLTIERETKAESAVPPELQRLVEGKQKPLLTADGKPVEKKLWLKTPDAEELYLDRLAVEKEIGYYTTDWTVLNLTDEEGDRKNLLPASGWYDVTVSGPATEQYRDYEPVFALVTLHWDEEGNIVDRDVQILETTHTPTKSSWSFSTDTLSTLVIAVPTDRPYIDETAKKPALTERTLVSGDGKVEVSGLLPEDAQLVVVEIPLNFAAELYSIRTGEAKAEEEILFAYDISILSDGEKFQPEDFGESVRVRIGGLNTEDGVSDVLHLKAGAVNQAGDLDLSSVGAAGSAESELLPASAEGDTVLFETDGFSVFVGASASAPAVRAASVIQDGDYEIDFDSGTITKCTAKGEVVIPTEIAGVTVRRIGKRAFTGPSTTSISVTIPEGVSISSEAFNSCIGLRSVTLPENLSGIPDDAFHGCENLVSVTIPKNVQTISTSAFSGCKRLQNVTFEDGSKLSQIGHCAFQECGLKSIEIPASVTSIGNVAFESCSNLKNVTFAAGSNLASIGDSAFYRCSSLWSIEIPASVTTIGGYAFQGCGSLGSIEIPSSVTSIGDYAFDGCESDIWYHGTESQWSNIPKGTNWAGSNLTVHCELSITVEPSGSGTVSASFGQDVPTPAAGKYWSNTDVTLTATANSNYAFVNWTENGSVVTGTDGNPVGATYTFTATTDRDLVAHFAIGGICGDHLTWTLDGNGTLTISGTGAMYDSVQWNGQKENIKKVVINNGVTTIGDLAFFQCVNLGSVEIPSSVTTIRSKAFEYCTNLTSVTFADGSALTSIGNFAFELCVNLQSIQIPSSVTSIGASAFLSCGNLESVTFAEGSALTSMGESAFQLCKKLTSVKIPSGVTSIENYAFDTCTGLTDVTIPSSVTTIGAGAFLNCGNLGRVIFAPGSQLASIGYSAFLDCGKLGSIEIPSSVKTIGTGAFLNCVKLENVTFAPGSQLVSIEYNAFYRCSILRSIEIPSSVKTIGTSAFRDCESLESVTIPSSVTSIGNFAFCNCSKLESVTIPSSVTSMGESAFQHCKKLTSVTIERSDPATVLAIGSDAFLCGTDSATLSWTGNTPAGQGVVFTVSPDTAGYSISGTTLSWNANPNSTAEATLRATFVQLPSAKLEVTKEFNDWSKADSFTFNLAAVTENAPLPANTTATATKNNSTASFGEITYNSVGTYKYTITEEDGSLPGVSYDRALHEVIVTVSKAPTTNVLTAAVEYDGQPYLIVTNIYATAAAPTIDDQPKELSWTYGDTMTSKKLSVSASASDGGTLSYQWYQNTTGSTTGGTEVTGATSAEYMVPGETQTDAGTYYYYCVVTNTKNSTTASTTSSSAKVTVNPAPFTITAKAQYYVYNGQIQGPGDTTYVDPADIAEKVTVVGLQGNDTVTSITIDGQGQEIDTYDLIPSGATITNGSGSVTANYNITYEKGTLTILPPAVAEIRVTKDLTGRKWSDSDSFSFTLAAVNGAPMPAKDTATATKDATTAVFEEIAYDRAGAWEYMITETNGGLDGVSYDTTSHTVLVTVTQADPTAAPTAEVKYDGQDSLTVTNTFTPATATLQVTKSLDTWRDGDSFSFTLAAVTENAPMPATAQATATEANPAASFGEVTYDRAGTWEYTITEVDGGITDVIYDTTPHKVVVTVSKKNATTNALSASVKYDGENSLEVTNTRPLRDVVIDSSIAGGSVVASPASAAAGDTVTLTVTMDAGSELMSLTAVRTDTGEVIKPKQDPNDPNLYSFVMPAGSVEVTATFKEIFYTVVEGADSSWLKGSNGDLSIKVKRDPKDETCFRHFRNGGSVAIDGEVLSEDSSALIQKDYKAEEGSTVITLHKKMLNRLSAGKHTVTITFDDGSVSTGLTILVPPGGYSPTTGDSSRIGFWAALMVLAGLGFAGADYARRKLRRPRYVGKH